MKKPGAVLDFLTVFTKWVQAERYLTQWLHRDSSLRTDYACPPGPGGNRCINRQSPGPHLEELQTIYRIQFPVLRQNENNTWYDQKGRVVFTCSKGLTGIGFSRTEWNEIKDIKEGVWTKRGQAKITSPPLRLRCSA